MLPQAGGSLERPRAARRQPPAPSRASPRRPERMRLWPQHAADKSCAPPALRWLRPRSQREAVQSRRAPPALPRAQPPPLPHPPLLARFPHPSPAQALAPQRLGLPPPGRAKALPPPPVQAAAPLAALALSTCRKASPTAGVMNALAPPAFLGRRAAPRRCAPCDNQRATPPPPRATAVGARRRPRAVARRSAAPRCFCRARHWRSARRAPPRQPRRRRRLLRVQRLPTTRARAAGQAQPGE